MVPEIRDLKWDKLSVLQRRVLKLAASGLDDETIAQRLTLTHVAVRHHLHVVYRKLRLGAKPGINRRVAAVLWYLGEE
jgi:DNA-binding NarL/FixJ family response regulator